MKNYLIVKKVKSEDAEGEVKEEIFSVYRTEKDAKFILKELGNKSQMKESKMEENVEFSIREVPSEINFGIELPSQKEEFSNIMNELDSILENLEK